MKVDAIVLAGGDGAVIDPACRFKGLLPIAGRPMVQWVAETLQAAELVEGVAVVVPTAEDLGGWVDSVDKLVVSDRSFMDNVLAGVASFRIDRPVLVTTGDLPLLTPEAVDDFVKSSFARSADFAYPLVRKEHMEEQFPGAQRTYVHLDCGEVTGGNMMLVNPALVSHNSRMGQRLFDSRKNAASMARVLGMRFVLKFALGKLNVAEVERKMGEVCGGSGAAVFTRHACIGVDVDKPADVVLVERALYDSGHLREGA